jgi:hypothetical protein
MSVRETATPTIFFPGQIHGYLKEIMTGRNTSSTSFPVTRTLANQDRFHVTAMSLVQETRVSLSRNRLRPLRRWSTRLTFGRTPEMGSAIDGQTSPKLM